MFKQRTELFGPLEQVTFFNDSSGDMISFLPSYGACINRLVLKQNDILDGLRDLEMLQHRHGFRTAWLFPWANRVRNGKYTFQGKSHQLPVNESRRNNALHGFAFKQKFLLEDVGLSEKIATAHLSWQYDGHFPGYPYPFDLDLFYEFTVNEGLRASYSIKNQGQFDMPFVSGWHPYFRFAEGMADDWYLQLHRMNHRHQVDKQMIPTGQTEQYDHFEQLRLVGNTQFDHCFEVEAREGRVEAILANSAYNSKLHLWQETGHHKYNFLQVYIPPHRKTLALEPMSSNVNAFNNGDELIVLGPGESNEASFGLWLEG